MNSKFTTVRKASEKYGVDQSLIYYWIRNRKFLYNKIGKKILFKEVDFTNFINSHSIPNNEDLDYE